MGKCYTIISKDKALTNKEINKIKSDLNDVNYEDIILNMEETKIDILLEEITTMSMFYDYKLIICNDAQGIFDNKNNQDLIDRVFSFFEKNIELSLVLIFYEQINNNYFKRLKTLTKVISLEQIDNNNIETFIHEYLTGNNYNISIPAANELVYRVNLNVDSLVNELDKLMLYKNDTHTIELDDIFMLVSKNLEDNVFTLVDMVLQHDSKRALAIYNDMLKLNYEQTMIISSLLNKFNEMYDVSCLIEERFTQNDIANIYNVKPGRAYYMMRNANSHNKDNILLNINALSNLEYNIKSGKEEKKVGFELYLLNI